MGSIKTICGWIYELIRSIHESLAIIRWNRNGKLLANYWTIESIISGWSDTVSGRASWRYGAIMWPNPLNNCTHIKTAFNGYIKVNSILRGCGGYGTGKKCTRNQQRPPTPKEGANGAVWGRCKKGSRAFGPSSMTPQQTSANRVDRHGLRASTQSRRQRQNVQIRLKFSSKNKLVQLNSR